MEENPSEAWIYYPSKKSTLFFRLTPFLEKMQHNWLTSDDLDFNLFIQSLWRAAGVGEGGKAEIRTDSHQSSVSGARSAQVHLRQHFSLLTH